MEIYTKLNNQYFSMSEATFSLTYVTGYREYEKTEAEMPNTQSVCSSENKTIFHAFGTAEAYLRWTFKGSKKQRYHIE